VFNSPTSDKPVISVSQKIILSLKKLPKSISQKKKWYRTLLKIYLSRILQEKEVKRIRTNVSNGEKIKVIFLLMDIPLWKTDSLYKRLEKDPRYEVIIVAIPRTNHPEMITHVDEVYEHFSKLRYNIVSSWDKKNKVWLDLYKDIQPDIVFITNPHKLTLPQYYIKKLMGKLTCYVPYFEQICDDYSLHFNNDTVNYCWRVFQINELHKKISKEYAVASGKNVLVTGYPAMEPFYDKEYELAQAWRDNNKKKIIIAPHHSIGNSTLLANATFVENADYFVELAKIYKDEVDFAFKPHPLLKQKLYEHENWGKERTEQYWEFWRKSDNTQLENGAYIDLFIGSDAMIHDCSSFIIEYLYVKKPVLYLNNTIRSGLNKYGQLGFDAVPKAQKSSDIEDFIKAVISGQAENIMDITAKLIPEVRPSVAITEHFSKCFDCELSK